MARSALVVLSGHLGKPCTTFRPAERGLAPERKLAFVFRTERTTAAYAFPQPNA